MGTRMEASPIPTEEKYIHKKTAWEANFQAVSAPRPRFELGTHRLTADCSTVELSRNICNERHWQYIPKSRLRQYLFGKICQQKK
jgi:hypothetical protein